MVGTIFFRKLNMKNMTKRLLVLCTLLLAPLGLLAQFSSPDLRFGGHTLGEPADVFFLTARTAESKQPTKDYCKSLLEDAKTKEKVQQYDAVAKNGGVFALNKKDFSFLDVGNCKQVMLSLEGKQANVGARLASEIGKGSALFASGKLSAFNLTPDSPYAEVISDMEKRFGSPGQKAIVSRPGWPPLQEMRWEREGVLAAVWKNQFSDGAIVIVGFLEPPYESFLRGSPAPESSASSTEACVATTEDDSKRVHVPPGVMKGLIVRRVQPLYPEPARQSRIEGVVTLAAVINKCGHVVDLKPVSGPEELVAAAMTAIKQWEYRPFVSGGQPTAVETELQVKFALSH
jgi:TonB family protein